MPDNVSEYNVTPLPLRTLQSADTCDLADAPIRLVATDLDGTLLARQSGNFS